MQKSVDNHPLSRSAWQRLLLPLMSLTLILGAIFFAVMSVIELREFYDRVQHRSLDLNSSFVQYESRLPSQQPPDRGYLEFKIKAQLEADALYRRYHQANATMLARVWTRQLGFLTGMILAVVGAAFVLGRLQGDATRIEAEGKGVKGALETSSPGIILCTLGTLLMAITLAIPFGVETSDSAIYLKPTLSIPAPSEALSLTLDDSRNPPLDPGPPPLDPGAAPPPDPGPAPAGRE